MCSDMVQIVKDRCRDCVTLTPDISAAASGDTKGNGESRSYDEWFRNFLMAYKQYGNYPDAGASTLMRPAPTASSQRRFPKLSPAVDVRAAAALPNVLTRYWARSRPCAR